jgi:ammonia channel protein AmtB
MKKETWGVVIVGLMLASYIVAYSRRIASWLGLRKTEEELEEGLDDKEENEE